MRTRSILFSLLACLALAVTAQPTQQVPEWEWYLDEVVSETFVGRNYFEYYYTPSAADMEQQRGNGEVTYFLNSPDGLNSKKVRDMIDRLMASYDDIKTVNAWQVTSTTYWKEFRYENNKFRFSVKRKALDDGTYYVSVTETAGYYKSLGNKGKKKSDDKPRRDNGDKSKKRAASDRRAITPEEAAAASDNDEMIVDEDEDLGEAPPATPVVSAKERRQAARESEKAQKQEEREAKQQAREQQREAKRQAREQQRAQEQARKEADKQLKAEEKKKKEDEKRLRKEQQRQQREQQRQERREQEQARRQAAAPKPVESRFHYSDIALWLSEKYDFTQTAGGEMSCTMFSTAVKDVEMAKLAIKNALKGSNARMAVPWRLNGDTGMVETGYYVDDHVLVFAVGKTDDDKVTLTVTEVTGEQFELFKQSM